MCGIVGYVGYQIAQNIVVDALSKLEYRGYDSAGIAYIDGNGLQRKRIIGGVNKLAKIMHTCVTNSSIMIGHTRWATHGRVSISNAHPHIDMTGQIAVVHNGIIENYSQLKDELLAKKVQFESCTDTEVIPNLIFQKLKGQEYTKQNILIAIRDTIQQLKGSFALCILIKDVNLMFATARFSPLMIAKTKTGCMIASDALGLCCGGDIYKMPDDNIAVLSKDDFECFDKDFNLQTLTAISLCNQCDSDNAYPFDSFMDKEIHESGQAIVNTVKTLTVQRVLEGIDDSIICSASKVVICACGTALHAGKVLGALLEHYCKMQCVIDYASEFRYRNFAVDKSTLCIFISQSGETADTLSCAEMVQKTKAPSFGITNVPTSRIVSLVDFVIPTSAGPERAVASTKAYMAQLCAAFMLSKRFCEVFGAKIDYDYKDLLQVADSLNNLKIDAFVEKISKQVFGLEHLYILGRGLDFITAQEGALKIKEISYIHCESMPLGELKHGSLALFGRDTYAIVIMTQSAIANKVISNIHEIRSRGAKVILLTTLDTKVDVEYCVHLPNKKEILSPFVATSFFQRLALAVAKAKNLNVDKPRNLAKSVTVE